MARKALPPGLRSRWPLALVREFRRDILAFLQMMAREYGDISFVQFGRRKVYLLNHPELVREVLVTQNKHFVKSRGLEFAKKLIGNGLLTSEGEFHLRQRRMMQPLFHRQRIAVYADIMSRYAWNYQERWHPGKEIDMAAEMMRLTLAIAGKTLFNTDVETDADEIGEALTTAMELFPLFTLPFYNLLDKLPLPSVRRFRKARRRLEATIYRMIAERRASGRDEGDVLSMLLQARDTETDGSRMTDRQVRDEAMTLLLAGHETTAIALTWTWYLLSEHPEVEARLVEEVRHVLGDRPATAVDVPRLPYTRLVLMESMRLFPPAYVLGRKPVVEVELGGYRVPRGAAVLMSPYLIQRDPRFYSEPERFIPDRWEGERMAALPKFAYFPFGGGPRICIGERFAWMEGILVLATIARRWRFRHVPGHPVALRPLITLRPRYGMRMIAELRHGQAARAA